MLGKHDNVFEDFNYVLLHAGDRRHRLQGLLVNWVRCFVAAVGLEEGDGAAPASSEVLLKRDVACPALAAK